MKHLVNDINQIQTYAPQMRNIFLNSDLSIILGVRGKLLFDRIKNLVDVGVVKKALRGVYVTEGWRLPDLAVRTNPDSYISGPSILSEKLMIGTIPQKKLYCVKKGTPRNYKVLGSTIHFYSLQESLYFGISEENGFYKALPEKALLDTLYFYLRGEKYFFDLFSDVSLHGLNKELFQEFLSAYKNPKFRSFANDYFAERY